MIRDLTPDEIEAAPEWATHYLVNDDSALLFESDNYFMYAGDGIKWSQTSGVSKLAQPIPGKEFDISKYTFSNESCLGMDSDGSLLFDGSHYGEDTCFDRDDIIAMAKLFKLTARDLL